LNARNITDPDSLNLLPNGDLAVPGEADQIIVFVLNPGAGNQSVSVLALSAIGTEIAGRYHLCNRHTGFDFFAPTQA
jgi:hypothetical protein